MTSDLVIGGKTHHISLTVSGTEYGFMLTPGPSAWKQMDISDFSPRIASGALGYRDLTMWQAWAQEDWTHGFGFPYATDESGYARSGSGIDTRHKGIATLATKITSSETGYVVNKFVDFDTKTYACLAADGGVRKYAAAAWAATSQTTGTVNDAIATGTYLVAALDGARAKKMDTAGTWTNAGNDTTPPSDFYRLCLHAGYLWGSEHGTNKLHYGSSEDISDLEGDGDADEIVVGPGNIPIVNMVSYAGVLYVAREDGLWIVDDTNLAYSQQDFSAERHASNFASMCIYKGHLYFTVRQNIWRYTGSTFMKVTPNRYNETFPYQTYGNFENLTPRGDFLYCTARDTETSFHETLLCFDGVGWHKLWDVVDTPYIINTMNLSPYNDYLWLNYTGVANTTSYYALQALSELPYASFPTTGNHYLYESVHDAGFVDVDKAHKALRFRTNNCSATQTITVAYSADDGAFTALGVVNTSPYQELTFAAGVYGKKLQLRFDLATADAAQTPVLEACALKYMLRPTTVWGWQLPILVADDVRQLDGRVGRDFTAAEKLTAIEAARNSKTVCTLTDIDGSSHAVWVTAVSTRCTRWAPGLNHEYVSVLSLADAS